MQSLIDATKPFASKSETRPILKNSLITEQFIFATDSMRLIRITHGQDVKEPFLHAHRLNEDGFSASSFPDVTRIIPDPLYAKVEFAIDLKEWMAAHKEILPHAKHHAKKTTTVDKQGIFTTDKLGERHSVPFTSVLLKEFTVTYNATYMMDALKAFKKLKETNITFYWFGEMNPFLLKSDNVTTVLLPIRRTY